METKTQTTLIDPVCSMEIPDTTVYRVTRNGELYGFCSEGCRERFLKHPSEYLMIGSVKRSPSARMAPASLSQKTSDDGHSSSRPSQKSTSYGPLLVVIDFTLLAACAKQAAYAGPWDGVSWMHDFMGLFLVTFAMLKFFDLRGFVDGFQTYDLVASRVRPYGYVYPLIEFGLGLAYLAQWKPVVVSTITIAVMLISGLGVIRALRRGLDVRCACMGSVLNLPLTVVAVVENGAMAAMAAAMLILGSP